MPTGRSKGRSCWRWRARARVAQAVSEAMVALVGTARMAVAKADCGVTTVVATESVAIATTAAAMETKSAGY